MFKIPHHKYKTEAKYVNQNQQKLNQVKQELNYKKHIIHCPRESAI